jgi:hypothetical protein
MSGEFQLLPLLFILYCRLYVCEIATKFSFLASVKSLHRGHLIQGYVDSERLISMLAIMLIEVNIECIFEFVGF